MAFNYEIKDSVLIVKLCEEIDHHNAEFIKKKVDKIIDMNYIKGLILDFDDTKFIDSSGIGVIIGRYNHMNNVGGKIGILNVSRNTDRLFKLSGIYKIINCYANIDEALYKII